MTFQHLPHFTSQKAHAILLVGLDYYVIRFLKPKLMVTDDVMIPAKQHTGIWKLHILESIGNTFWRAMEIPTSRYVTIFICTLVHGCGASREASASVPLTDFRTIFEAVPSTRVWRPLSHAQ